MSEEKKLTEHLFRRKYGEILAALLRSLGYRNFELAEEAVQTAFQRALEVWPYSGIPTNPAGWLYSVARNASLEVLRRKQTETQKINQLQLESQQFSEEKLAFEDLDLQLDDLLAMILLCCNPELNPKAQVSLTLKAACGFSVKEIARALGMAEEAIKKTITRAKEKVAADPALLQDLNQQRIADRFPLVMETLYAMFTEGHSASGGESQLRREIAEEAIRLAGLILPSKFAPDESKGELQALLALMLLQGARFDARADRNGTPLRLQDQDRGKWNQGMIRAGLAALAASKVSKQMTAYHIEARIAAEHSTSASFDAINWETILALYEQLLAFKDSQDVKLNRIVALRYAKGAAVALRELETFASTDLASGAGSTARTFLFHATKADLLESLARFAEALQEWEKALENAPTAADRSFVEEKLKKLS